MTDAFLVLFGAGIIGGLIGALVFTLALRPFLWTMKREIHALQVGLTKEVKSRASETRWAADKVSAQVLRDIAALQAGGGRQEWSREELRTGVKRADGA